MRKATFYPKLALENIMRNRQFYFPYILTCMATVSMFYIMCFLTYSKGMTAMASGTLAFLFSLGCIVIGLFSVIFLFYNNSFLIKRRQKELGLYSILGMGKGNISGVLLFETLFIAIISIGFGLLFGIILSKLMLLLLLRILNFPVPYGFEISIVGVLLSLALFAGIFFVILLSNMVRIKLSNPIELLHGGNVGEKEPKTKWILSLLGVIALAGGYYIAITVKSPVEAIGLFFIAVILVIIGTYLLFTTTSIAILKRLKANPNYYYKTRHFIPVSGMIYRMKQHAVGLANICILSTMVLVMVSGTVCLYLGTEDSVNGHFPNDIIIRVQNPTGNTRSLASQIEETVVQEGFEPINTVDCMYFDLLAVRNGSDFGNPHFTYYSDDINSTIMLMSSSEYQYMTGEKLTLSNNEVFADTENAALGDGFRLYDKDYTITGQVSNFPKLGDDEIINHFAFVVSDEAYSNILATNTEDMPRWYYGFDVKASGEEKLALYDTVNEIAYAADSSSLEGGFYSLGTDCQEEQLASFLEFTGGFLFLGIFLGIIFLMATVLIIYYKQLSEGYDDRTRFEIMQKVGLSKAEIKKAIHSQILTVFFLPIGIAVIHICFAFNIITRMLTVFYLTNVPLFAICTVGTIAVFALIYGIVYALTAKTYYKIVSA